MGNLGDERWHQSGLYRLGYKWHLTNQVSRGFPGNRYVGLL
jgi:hypothetical protein